MVGIIDQTFEFAPVIINRTNWQVAVDCVILHLRVVNP